MDLQKTKLAPKALIYFPHESSSEDFNCSDCLQYDGTACLARSTGLFQLQLDVEAMKEDGIVTATEVLDLIDECTRFIG